MRIWLIICLLIISTAIGFSQPSRSFTVSGDSAVAPTNLYLPGKLRATNSISAIGGLEVFVGQTNFHLTASKIILTGAGKQLTSSAFGESDLASFVTSAVTNGFATISYVDLSVNGSSNALRTLIFAVTNGLATIAYVMDATNTIYTTVTSDINAASNALRTLTVNATNTLAGNITTQINSTSNSLVLQISAVTNGLATTNLFSIIIGTNGITVSSNLNNGNWLIDGSSLSNSIAGALSNKVDELNGVATNLFAYGLTNFGAFTATNSLLTWGNPGGRVTFRTDGTGTRAEIFAEDAGVVSLQFDSGGSIVWPLITPNTLLRVNTFNQTVSVATGTGALTNDGAGTFGWFPNYITLVTASNALDFNPNQFTRTGTGGTNINISSGSLQTNNIFYGTTEHRGVQTNTGAINTAGVETNWNDVYMRTNVTMALNQANKWPYNIPDLALTTTNSTGGVRWEDFFPNPTRRRFAMLLVNASGAISWFGEANANSGTLAYETPTTNQWWTVSYATSASANADAGGNTTSQAFSPGQDLVWDWVGRIDAIGTNNVRHWIGLTSTTLANMGATDSPTTRSVAAVRFSQSVPDTEWKFVTCDGSACTVTTSTTAATTNLVHFKLVEDYANARWIFFLNGVPAATNSANLPIATMGSIMSVRTLINKAYIIRTSMMSCFQSDKQTILQYP